MGQRSVLLDGETHVDTAAGAFGGALHGATKHCTGWGRRIWTPPLGPSVELHMVPRNAVLGWGNECGHTGAIGGVPNEAKERRDGWGRRTWTPPLVPPVGGHETLSVEHPVGPRKPVLRGGDACGHRH
eukprot:4590042-Pyramimonas_sp.AAC.1